jgi:hypothetical protein
MSLPVGQGRYDVYVAFLWHSSMYVLRQVSVQFVLWQNAGQESLVRAGPGQ